MLFSSISKLFRFAFFNLLAILALLIIIEGAASLFVHTRRALLFPPQPFREQQHSQYDAELGWRNIPNLNMPNLYGPGISLSTNNQAFRNDQEFSAQIPNGKKRVICSGDSFTLGYGVRNQQTWCNLLSEKEPTLETVNMGQGGYGIDQSYLWYRRDGAVLDHDLLLFAFISEDFRRMQSSTFLGYPKPVLRLEDGNLVSKNTPVPKKIKQAGWFESIKRRIAPLGNLQTVRLGTNFAHRSGLLQKPADPFLLTQPELLPITLAVFQDLSDRSKDDNRQLVLLHLPDSTETTTTENLFWRHYLRGVSARMGFAYVDLLEKLEDAGQQEDIRQWFNPQNGHYSVKGNQKVAQLVHAYALPKELRL